MLTLAWFACIAGSVVYVRARYRVAHRVVPPDHPLGAVQDVGDSAGFQEWDAAYDSRR